MATVKVIITGTQKFDNGLDSKGQPKPETIRHTGIINSELVTIANDNSLEIVTADAPTGRDLQNGDIIECNAAIVKLPNQKGTIVNWAHLYIEATTDAGTTGTLRPKAENKIAARSSNTQQTVAKPTVSTTQLELDIDNMLNSTSGKK